MISAGPICGNPICALPNITVVLVTPGAVSVSSAAAYDVWLENELVTGPSLLDEFLHEVIVG